MRTARYSALITDAVDEGLSMLGRLPKKAIYEALENDFSMQRKDIPMRFAEFSSILIDNIGPGTKPVLEHIVDRFSSGIHDKALPYIDLDESIKRVDTILRDSRRAQKKQPKKMPTDGSSR